MAPPSPRISTYLHTLSLHAALPISIDLGLFPLGSCTMKHNPRLNEKIARLPGFADVHPLAPVDTVQGALGVINELAFWLIGLTGMHGIAMSPKAGAHGELFGILYIGRADV